MRFVESETVELKREYVKDIRKEIVAFANTMGGTVYIGVEDDGRIVGVEKPDDVMLAVMNSIRDAVRPDIMGCLKCEVLWQEEKAIVAVTVPKGPDQPYYLREKGLSPSGVFIRNGSASNPASRYFIKRMIQESLGSFESMLSLEQNLTFHQMEEEFSKRGMELGENQLRSLGVMDADGLYTNLGLLVSDQCPHIIKGAVFQGVDCLDFQDREEFSGSVFKQLADAYRYMELNNHTKATFDGLYRKDQMSYPPVALREALINAVVHRDYSSVAVSSKISIFADRIEILSYGGLPTDITLEMAMQGVSACRNPLLANIFYRLKLIEMYGTGFSKMYSGYAVANPDSDIYNANYCLPKFEAIQGMFKVTMPNLAYEAKPKLVGEVREARSVYAARDCRQTIEQRIMALLANRQQITRREVEAELGVSLSTATRIINKLLGEEKIISIGRGKNTCYVKNLV